MTVNSSKLKTHIVLDLHYHVNDGQGCFCGTQQECDDFMTLQSPYFMYSIVPMTREEIELYPDNQEILL